MYSSVEHKRRCLSFLIHLKLIDHFFLDYDSPKIFLIIYMQYRLFQSSFILICRKM